MGEQSSRSDDEVSEGEYCTDKLGSSSGGELQTLVEVGEESFAQTLDGD